MGRSASLLVGFALALPIAIEAPAGRDSTASGSETRLTAVGGINYYAIIDRGCEGQVIGHHPVHARDGAIALEHRFSSPFVVGVRGGLLHDEIGDGLTRENSYWNPYASYEV